MNKIRICCNKGTSFIESEPKHSKWVGHNEHLSSRISKEKKGQRVTALKGTSTLWIEKIPRVMMYYPKILIHSRGTKRLEI